jgi:phospholipase/carboxylesterase
MWERPFDKLRTGFSREPFGCVTGDPEKLAAEAAPTSIPPVGDARLPPPARAYNAAMDTRATLETVEHETAPEPRWTVLWLHGLGADGHDFAPIVPELVRRDWPPLRFVFPHAPLRAVTVNNGMRMRAWYDIRNFSADELAGGERADSAGVLESVAQVEALIAREGGRGVPPQRLVLAGFSQGGAVALATGLRRAQPLAGLVALSTYLPMAPQARADLQPGAAAQPVFMAHGLQDPVVPHVAGERSAGVLRELGFALDWHAYPMGHAVCADEIGDLGDWLSRRFALA